MKQRDAVGSTQDSVQESSDLARTVRPGLLTAVVDLNARMAILRPCHVVALLTLAQQPRHHRLVQHRCQTIILAPLHHHPPPVRVRYRSSIAPGDALLLHPMRVPSFSGPNPIAKRGIGTGVGALHASVPECQHSWEIAHNPLKHIFERRAY